MQKAFFKIIQRKLNKCKRLHNTKVLDKTNKNVMQFSTLCTKIGTLSKNYQFRLDIPLVDCYNIKVLKTEAEMLR